MQPLGAFAEAKISDICSLLDEVDRLLEISSKCSADISTELQIIRTRIGKSRYQNDILNNKQVLATIREQVPKHILLNEQNDYDENILDFFILYEDLILEYLRYYTRS